MKSLRTTLIISGLIALAGLGFVAYSLLWGPDHIQFEGRDLLAMLKSGELVPLVVIPLAVIVSIAVIVPVLRIMFPPEIKNGIAAPAKVLQVRDTGTTINDDPLVGLLLEVTPAYASPFQAEVKTLVSRLNAALVQPGITAEVVYDPQKPQRIQVKKLNVKSAAPTQAVARMEELNELSEKDLITAEEYRRKREDILNEL